MMENKKIAKVLLCIFTIYYVCFLLYSLIFIIGKIDIDIKLITSSIAYILIPVFSLYLIFKDQKYAGFIGIIQSILIIISTINEDINQLTHIGLIYLILSVFYTKEYYN